MSRRTYHHGDLRRALMDAALSLVTERGPQGFTLTEAARRAGVSAAAPYRHFADKEALLAAVAIEGFQGLAAELAGAAAATDPRERFSALGRAYVSFALAQPSLHQVMFGVSKDVPAVSEAAAPTFGHVVAAADALRAAGAVSEEPIELAVTAWAFVHGVATLFQQGILQKKELGSAEEVARRGLEAIVRGKAPPG